MPEDGDGMHVHDEERSAVQRRLPSAREAEQNADWQGARRAVEAGHVRGVEHGAMLHLQRLAGNAGVGALVGGEAEEQRSPVLDVVGKGGGAPLRSDLRVQMESGLGADFGDVRVHEGGAAADSARAVDAKAYTVGSDVVFGHGAYQPDTPEGRHTLAHELTHVVQQRSGPVDGTSTGDGVALSDPGDRFEREAEASASAFERGDSVSTPAAAAPAVQREESEADDVGAQAMPLQREEAEDEESAQAMPLQREGEEPEEEEASAQTMPLQREEMAEEEQEAG